MGRVGRWSGRPRRSAVGPQVASGIVQRMSFVADPRPYDPHMSVGWPPFVVPSVQAPTRR